MSQDYWINFKGRLGTSTGLRFAQQVMFGNVLGRQYDWYNKRKKPQNWDNLKHLFVKDIALMTRENVKKNMFKVSTTASDAWVTTLDHELAVLLKYTWISLNILISTDDSCNQIHFRVLGCCSRSIFHASKKIHAG